MVKEEYQNPKKVLMARYVGTDEEGGPSCASIGLMDGGWVVADR